MLKTVVFKNAMQRGRYFVSARVGRDFHEPGFTPALRPYEMLQLGVFEGKYINSAMSEYPASWARGAKLSDTPDPSINLFGVRSRQLLPVWLANGWINQQDPRGWFEWYCRYYMGRRIADDDRQIRRWRAFVRHSAQVRKHGGANIERRPVQRQALLQWSHDPFPDFLTRTGESTYQKIRRIMKDNT